MRLPPLSVVVVVVIVDILVGIVVIGVHEQIIGEQAPSLGSELAVRAFLHQYRHESPNEYTRISGIRWSIQ